MSAANLVSPVGLFGADETGRAEGAVDLGPIGTGPWVLLGVLVVTLLSIDLWRHRHAHEPSPREALLESAFWVACGLAFAGYVFAAFGAPAFGEYLSGYLIEKALSVDNVFVWSVIFSTLAIPLQYQHRVLFLGIFGALVMRGMFIFLGVALLERFEFLLIVFGVFLIYTGIKIFGADGNEDVSSSRGLALLERVMPITEKFDQQRFVTRIDGRRVATPLLAALVVVELSDLVFAVDSVPAILAISKTEYLILSSNAFAILGLRAMYFLLATARERFTYLSHGLGIILVFVGLKMTLARWYHVNIWLSLGLILAMLGGSVVASELATRRADQASADHRVAGRD